MGKVTLLAAAVAASQALAYEPFSYRYVEAGWHETTTDTELGLPDDDIESSGWSVGGSWSFDNLIIQLGYGQGEIDKVLGLDPDDFGVDLDTQAFGVRIGGAGQIDDRTSLFGGFGYTSEKLDLDGDESVRIDGWSMGGGVRWWAIERVELNAELAFIHARSDDLDTSENDFQVTLGARFYALPSLSVGASYSALLDAESESIGADVRWQF